MSKNPSDRTRMPGEREGQQTDRDRQPKGSQNKKEQQMQHRQGEPLGQDKNTGQKFTSDEDIVKARRRA